VFCMSEIREGDVHYHHIEDVLGEGYDARIQLVRMRNNNKEY
jgi:hypothetical protein